MDLIKEINRYKKIIDCDLEKLKEKYFNLFKQYKKDSPKYLNQFIDFAKRGKGVRGALVFLTEKLFEKPKIEKETLKKLALVFEVIHSSLLIHDDIMDNDSLRRGQPTIHVFFNQRYREFLKEKNDNLGKSIALSLGDIGFFIAFDILSSININPKIKNFLAQELIKTGLAQIDDVFFSQTKIEPEIDDILAIYKGKTSRYTFVLPILTILKIKNINLQKQKIIEEILEDLGIIFQISDDLIGIFSEESGKDKGSDIREDKKTIIRYLLFKDKKTPTNIKKIFGKNKISKDEMENLKSFINQSNVKKEIENIIKEIKNKIQKKMKKNKQLLPNKFIALVNDFIDYLITRRK
jgi:geranylgeranyl diphosphate synthase type I